MTKIMKKTFFLAAIILLVAAGCNQAAKNDQKQSSNQDQPKQEQQASSSDNISQSAPASKPGPMPKMTYKVTVSHCVQNDEYATIALYAAGKQVTVYKSTICDINKVVFRTGNSEAAYFSIEPSGLGGYYSYSPAFDLYRLDLTTKTVEKINTGDYWIGGVDFDKDLTKVIYAPYENAKQGVVIQNLATGAKESFQPVPVTGKERAQIGNVKFSPNMAKAAIAVAYGPDAEYGEIYILDLATNSYTLYKKIDSGHLQVKGWKNNSEVDWSKI
jgi:hypothetical protein